MTAGSSELARVVHGAGWEPEDDPEPNGTAPPQAFRRHDMAETVRTPIPRPKTLANLIYPGKLHTLSGEPESGKTLTGLWFLLQAIHWERHVVLVDEEMGAQQTGTLLQAMGADPDALDTYLHYYPFVQSNWMNPRVLDELHKLLADIGPVVAMFDSSAAMMASSGINEDRSGEVRRFWNVVLGPIARERDCAVIVIDHDAKGGADTRYSRGSGDKLAVVDMTMKMSIETPFTRDTDGVINALVTKDRLGCLHRPWQITVTRDPLTLTWHQATKAQVTKAATASKSGTGSAKAKLLSVITMQPAPPNELVDRVVGQYGHGLTRETVSRELAALADEGSAERVQDGRRVLWCLPAPPGQPEPTGLEAANSD